MMAVANIDRSEWTPRERLMGCRQLPPRVRRSAKPPPALPAPPPLALPAMMPQWKRIILEVASEYGVTAEAIIGPGRERRVVAPRHCAMYRMFRELGTSPCAIGRRLGNRDHTTVLSGIKRHEAMMTEAAGG